MNTYMVRLLPNGDEMLPYIITTHANTEEEAVEQAKRFVAENGYWPSALSIEERMNRLVVHFVTMTHSSETTTY